MRVAVEDVPAGTAGALLERAGPLPFATAIRLTAESSDFDAALEARLTDFARRQRKIWLALPAPDGAEAVDRWRLALRRLLDRHAAALTMIEILIDRQSPRVAAYAVQNAASEIGERRTSVRVGLGGPAIADADRRATTFTADLSPYVDLLVVPDEHTAEAGDWLRKARFQTPLAVAPGGRERHSAADMLEDLVADLAAERSMRAWRAGDLQPDALKALARLGPLLEHPIASLDDTGVQLTLTQAGQNVAARVPHWLLFDPETFATFLAYRGPRSAEPLGIGLNLSVDGTPALIDLSSGKKGPLTSYQRNTSGRVEATTPLTGETMLVSFNEGADPIADRSDVTAARALTVGEIIARHQQQQRAQDAVLQNYVAHVRMEQHFRPTVADPGYDVVTENRYFSAPDGVEWEEFSFCVNGACWGADRPPFPLLQPEKVLALPLELRFDEGYRYRLAGSDRIDGFDCYEIRFEPVRQDSALYTGTVWIDKRTFARIRVKASQGGLSAPVVSNEEDQHFSAVATIGNRPIFMFSSLTAQQIMLVAGRNLLVEKRVQFSDFRVNDLEFDRDRASARESRHVMFRETAAGLRYYVAENGRRVVSDRGAIDLRALAMGVTLDPSYSFPLPILGIDYIDFQFGNQDTQLAVLFAGVLAAGNVQRSHLFGQKNLDASVDFFAIGVPSSDRIYDAGIEDESIRLLTWPLSTGLNVGWQASRFMKATFQYQFRFDGYVRDRTTAEQYTTPSSTLTNGVGGAWEYRRGGYSFTFNGTLYKRIGWRPWGLDAEETPSSYVKYSAGATRDFFLGPFQKIHLNGAWFGGEDLDRLNKYQFGMFDDTRIHGVPSSGVRFGELAMFRGAYSFNLFDQYRLDLFAEQAWGRDDPGAGDWQRIPGFGFALNVRAPWNTILRADFGKALLPGRYGSLGSTTLQIMLLKPLR